MENNDLAMFTALVGFFMPIVISVVQQPRWQPRTRTLVAILSSIIAGGGTVYLTDPGMLTNGTTMTTVILTVLIASTTSYRAVWIPLGLRQLESRTSLGDDTFEIEQATEAERLAAEIAGSYTDEN